jgi:hypothetical protein
VYNSVGGFDTGIQAHSYLQASCQANILSLWCGLSVKYTNTLVQVVSAHNLSLFRRLFRPEALLVVTGGLQVIVFLPQALFSSLV